MSNEPDELSPEAKSAMQMALRVLEGDGERLQVPILETRQVESSAGLTDRRPTALQMAVELRAEMKIIYIIDRNSIPISEEYALVMEGLSTYSFEHARGASFVVDNSRNNRDRDREYRDALNGAVAFAKSRGLKTIYVLE